MEGKESVKCGIVYREASSDSLYEYRPNIRNSGEEVGNYCCSSETYLSSREYIANKGCCYSCDKDNNSNISDFKVKVGAVINSPTDVEVETDKEPGATVGMEVTEESPVINVPSNVG